MSRLQAIEQALSAKNGVEFQELCDSYLALRNDNYAAYTRIGSQSGKQKTVAGTPDLAILLPSGKYLFAQHSTDITRGLSKLKEDIANCLNPDKTKIAIDQIDEIILCINFNLKTGEIQKLYELLLGTRIKLTLVTLDSLSIELSIQHRDLVHRYLGLPMDTGQIVSIDQFIEEYGRVANGIATPLDNTFLHREEELQSLKNSILNSDFTILVGPAGVGKTKLTLESMKSFLKDHLEFGAYCISNKSHDLLSDLHSNLPTDKNFLLFVDDANRIDTFGQIVGFYKTIRKGKLKIIITVRDYALDTMQRVCGDFFPSLVYIDKLTDNQIVDIIKAQPFGILNPDYHREITRVADGNPRLAIMSALLVKERQSLSILHDVSDLFDTYFATFVKDQEGFADYINIKCLGLIAFFHVLPYKDKNVIDPILDSFGLTYDNFIDTIEKLDNLELLEIQFEYVKVGEQNLATYFFYRTFIKEELLSFGTLLEKHFSTNQNRFTDTVIASNNTFGAKKVMDKLKPKLKKYWAQIKENEESARQFLSSFWYYLSDEALAFVHDQITNLSPERDVSEYKVEYGVNDFAHRKNRDIELLGRFFLLQDESIKYFIELSLELGRKRPELVPEILYKIREQLSFDKEDGWNRFMRQERLLEIIYQGIEKHDLLTTTLFFEFSKTFLHFQFRHTRGGRNRSIELYEYRVFNTNEIQNIRKGIWERLDSLFEQYSEKVTGVLEYYVKSTPDANVDIMAFDLSFLLSIIKKRFTKDNFDHCYIVKNLIRWFRRKSVVSEDFTALEKEFTNDKYRAYLVMDWDRIRDKEMFEFDDHDEYMRLKTEEVVNNFVLESTDQVLDFYNNLVFLKGRAKRDWGYTQTFLIVLNATFEKDFDRGIELLQLIIDQGNALNLYPGFVFVNTLKEREQVDRIWQLIQNKPINYYFQWAQDFWNNVNEALLETNDVRLIVDEIDNIPANTTVVLRAYERFRIIDQGILTKIASIVADRNESENANLTLWNFDSAEYFETFDENSFLIKRTYLQQLDIQEHFDYNGEQFVKIATQDVNFIMEYVKHVFRKDEFSISGKKHGDLGAIWKIDGVEQEISNVFDFMADRKETYLGILEHFCNVFFVSIPLNLKQKADDLLIMYLQENISDPQRINLVIDVIRNSHKELFEKAVLTYVSLNQDEKQFAEIYWRGNGASGVGNDILGDIEAADWHNLMSIISKSDLGFKLLAIKRVINKEIERCEDQANWERKRRFAGHY